MNLKQEELFPSFSAPLQKISFSKIATFLRCPYEYKYTFINNESKFRRWGPKIGIGFSLHSALRDFYRITNLKERTLDNLIQLLKLNWSTKDFNNIEEEQFWLEKAENILSTYYLQNDHNIIPIFIEKHFNAKIDKLIFTGKIDRIDKNIDGSYEVIDYKYENYIDHEIDDLQMTFYYCGCKYGLGIIPNKMSFYILDNNKRITTSRSSEDEVKGLNRIRLILSEMESIEVFNPKINHLCENCWLKMKCPAHKK